jgi:hypothetical protein
MKRGLFVLALGACVPSLGSTDAVVSSPRILAVRADPAEAKPGASVTVTALVASPGGTVMAPAIAWSFCTAPKPLTEDNVVSSACLDGSSSIPAGDGAAIMASTPAVGCSLFGPIAPQGGARPRDPDATGGYYQPLRADLAGSDAAFALLRITCDLANAPAASAAAFAAAYRPNENPKLLPVSATVDGASVSLSSIPAGARVELTANWPAASVETYAYYDAASDTITSKRESMSLTWYVTAGTLDTEATGRADDDPATSSNNTWTAPPTAEAAFLWIVLRDSRGGVDYASYELTVVR